MPVTRSTLTESTRGSFSERPTLVSAARALLRSSRAIKSGGVERGIPSGRERSSGTRGSDMRILRPRSTRLLRGRDRRELKLDAKGKRQHIFFFKRRSLWLARTWLREHLRELPLRCLEERKLEALLNEDARDARPDAQKERGHAAAVHNSARARERRRVCPTTSEPSTRAAVSEARARWYSPVLLRGAARLGEVRGVAVGM
jgi:hypothetical protein